jgi:hypothetical protein
MTKAFALWCSALLFPITLLVVTLHSGSARAQNQKVYNPISLPANNEISDTLSDKDIPMGEGGFARDYLVKLEGNDQVAIDLTSESFDTMVTLIAADGSTVGQNDDGPDGSTNSLLFARIKESGQYIIRVRAFGETGSGAFKLKVTRLRPVEASK